MATSMSITLAEAQKIAQSAIDEGARRGTDKMSIVITDPGGHVRLAIRTENQGIFGVETATAKARSALGYNRPTLELTPLFSAEAVAGITAATGGRFAPIGGGVVVTNKDDVIVGAAAMSGNLPELDHDVIVAAVTANGFKIIA